METSQIQIDPKNEILNENLFDNYKKNLLLEIQKIEKGNLRMI